MSSKRKILAVLDPMSEAEQMVVERGAFLASALDAELELLVCYNDPYLTGVNFADYLLVEKAKQAANNRLNELLENAANPVRKKGLSVTTTIVWDRPLDEGIIRHVLKTSPWVVLKETHYHHKLTRALFTNTDWNLVRNCPVPLWLVKPRMWPENAKILASVDPMQEHDKPAALDGSILDLGELLANSVTSELHVFHAYVPILLYQAGAAVPVAYPVDRADKALEKVHKEKLDELLAGREVPKDGVHMIPGYATQLLPKLASDLDVGVVIMGSIARNPFKRVFLGSTTEKVLPKISCDLLVVKPDWFQTSVEEKSPFMAHVVERPGDRDVQTKTEEEVL